MLNMIRHGARKIFAGECTGALDVNLNIEEVLKAGEKKKLSKTTSPLLSQPRAQTSNKKNQVHRYYLPSAQLSIHTSNEDQKRLCILHFEAQSEKIHLPQKICPNGNRNLKRVGERKLIYKSADAKRSKRTKKPSQFQHFGKQQCQSDVHNMIYSIEKRFSKTTTQLQMDEDLNEYESTSSESRPQPQRFDGIS
ncbi:Oidioi.mRNA.OKI2018_I69.chr1.g2445.t1.cds [Oikopleura dioica]|uniref:Oidioi.mRNA.OKI2018_I69.chr1.g2445.t1.cds n=1 Tax=Oikopleura dioica TaxID=34765 RepID=A0ABN7SXH5_OIKDI|nr:Oidioi.mRNA.OKI2018_I69.chr1.g2445.t1.cds [Oikopleura dioica]